MTKIAEVQTCREDDRCVGGEVDCVFQLSPRAAAKACCFSAFSNSLMARIRSFVVTVITSFADRTIVYDNYILVRMVL